MGLYQANPGAGTEVADLRTYLEAHNGMKGLEILEPSDVQHAAQLFRRDGFVVIANALTSEQTDFLAKGCAEATA